MPSEVLRAVLHNTITRPARANERMDDGVAGQVVTLRKSPWSQDTTQLVMSVNAMTAELGLSRRLDGSLRVGSSSSRCAEAVVHAQFRHGRQSPPARDRLR